MYDNHPHGDPHRRDDNAGPSTTTVARFVRGNTLSAAIGAACLLYFGFVSPFIKPTGTDLFDRGGRLLCYTMPVGGVAMAVVTVLCLTGRGWVLLLDAVVSIPIGLALLASGLMMLPGAGLGLQQILLIVFGGLFIRDGWNTARRGVHLGRLNPASRIGIATPPSRESTEPFRHADAPPRTDPYSPARPDVPGPARPVESRVSDESATRQDEFATQYDESAAQYDGTTTRQDEPAAPRDESTTPRDQPTTDDTLPTTGDDPSVRQPDDPASDGFLASFADPPPNDKPD